MARVLLENAEEMTLKPVRRADILPGDVVQHTGSLRRGRVVEIGKTHRDGTIEYRMKVEGDDPAFEVWWNSAGVRRIPA